MKYILMFAGTKDEQNDYGQLSKEAREAEYAKVGVWWEKHSKAGTLIGGEQLQGPDTATTVRHKNGKTTVTDGPFIESKEVLGGFYIIEAANYDEAVARASDHPTLEYGGTVEVRQVWEP